ncbi:MAG TPA: VIT domain-containing protein, partial [Gemmatimonadaceae bacterium]|nr:VIT domain-containing protein [Gemmatimonadaceae bacterium]
MPRLRSLVSLLLLGAATAAGAQGRIIPRPCVAPGPQPRPDIAPPRCPPVRSAVERTRSEVRVELVDRVLRYEIEERFVNRGGLIGEADYLFPLPRGAAFQDLKLSIDGEMVAGETLGAEEARRIYEEIVRRQRDPALVEWMGQGLLRTRIFPIQPGEERRIVVRLQAVAEREGDALRVDWSRGRVDVDSRAGVGGWAPGAPPRQQGGATPRGGRDRSDADRSERTRTAFTFTYTPGAGLGTAYSPTHELRVREQGGRRVVEVSGEGRD